MVLAEARVQAAPPPPKRLSRFLQSNAPGTLASLVAEVDKLRELDATLKSLLNEPLRSKVRVAAVRDRTLVIHAESAVWATRARYTSGKIIRKINDLDKRSGIRSITVRVAPEAPAEQPRSQPRRLPAGAADCLRTAAAGIRDVAVQTALRRLADNADD